MAASSRGVSAARGLWQTSRLCTRCATTGATIRAPAFSAAPIFRSYSGAAAAATTAASGSPSDLPPNLTVPAEPKATQAPKSQYKLKGGIILTRAPLLTAEPTKFEEAFYFYQKRLNERLCMPFVTKVYFKPDTPGLMDWNIKVGERKGTPGKEIGVYQGKSASAWQDELMVGDDLSSHKKMYETLLKDAEARVSDEAEIIPEEDRVPVEALPPRISEADIKGDTTRLDRAMDRTLYFVVKGEDGKWQFPSTALDTEHNLHQAARYVMNRTAGVNMNTWLVGRVPVAHRVVAPTLAEDGSVKARGEKTFFIKGRIMAGQADLNGNPYGYTEFKWLTREELQKDHLEPEYFHAVRNMMADR